MGRRSISLGVVVAVIAFTSFGCHAPSAPGGDSGPGGNGGGGAIDGGSGGVDSGGGDAGCDVIIDCLEHFTCANGIVDAWPGLSPPCSEFTGVCPHQQAYVCQEGCRIDANDLTDAARPSELCEENRPRNVGEPCTTESDCDPQVAVVSFDGGIVEIENVYLSCDQGLGSCVAADPVTVPDYLNSCGAVTLPTGPSRGAVASTVCGGGLCLFDRTRGCGCTAACEHDGDCPLGSLCNLPAGCAPGYPCQEPGYCKPGLTQDWRETTFPLQSCTP